MQIQERICCIVYVHIYIHHCFCEIIWCFKVPALYCVMLHAQLLFLCIFDGILNNPHIPVFNTVFWILVGAVVVLAFFSSWVSVSDVLNAWKTWKLSFWKLIQSANKKINCTFLGKWKGTSYSVWQILHSWDTRFDRYQKWLCQLGPAAGIWNGKLCWVLFGFSGGVFSPHTLFWFCPFRSL